MERIFKKKKKKEKFLFRGKYLSFQIFTEYI